MEKWRFIKTEDPNTDSEACTQKHLELTPDVIPDLSDSNDIYRLLLEDQFCIASHTIEDILKLEYIFLHCNKLYSIYKDSWIAFNGHSSPQLHPVSYEKVVTDTNSLFNKFEGFEVRTDYIDSQSLLAVFLPCFKMLENIVLNVTTKRNFGYHIRYNFYRTLTYPYKGVYIQRSFAHSDNHLVTANFFTSPGMEYFIDGEWFSPGLHSNTCMLYCGKQLVDPHHPNLSALVHRVANKTLYKDIIPERHSIQLSISLN